MAHHKIFDLLGWDRLRRTSVPPAFLGRAANVIAIPFTTGLRGVVWSHGCVAAYATHESLEQRAEFVADRNATGFAVVLE